jgi:flagellar hook-associated protein 1 FlgK
MRTTFFGLEIVRKGLQTQQRALDVTGHNIANANTPGYTRQSAIIGTTTPWTVPGMNKAFQAGQIGTGAKVEEIRRIRDSFIDLQVRNESKELGYWEAKADVLQKLEVIINEPSDSGIRTVMDQFWASLQELSKNPESEAVRATVRQRGVAVADTFNHIHRQLRELQEDIGASVKVKVNQINSLATQIRDLNDQIVRIEVGKTDNANDLRDRRDNLLDELSKLVDIKYNEDQYGAVRISIGGKGLVLGSKAALLEASDQAGLNGLSSVRWQDGGPLNLTSGELLGLIQSMGYQDTATGESKGIIPEMIRELNHLANSIVTAANWVHRQGYPKAGDKGILFFQQERDENGSLLPVNAWSIRVSDAIMADTANIAASLEKNMAGDGRNALALAQLKHLLAVVTDVNYLKNPPPIPVAMYNPPGDPEGQALPFKDFFEFYRYFLAAEDGYNSNLAPTATFDDFFRGLVGRLGINTQEAERMVLNQQMLVSQQQNRREMMSGVSLDEEMTNMIMFQHAYNAAARTISTMDEMLEVLINRVGIVGR